MAEVTRRDGHGVDPVTDWVCRQTPFVAVGRGYLRVQPYPGADVSIYELTSATVEYQLPRAPWRLMTETPKKTARVVFTPTKDRLLVRGDKAEERTAGGIFVPDMAKNRPTRGTVVAVGPEVPTEDKTGLLRPGARVLHGRYSGGQVNVNGEELLVMRLDEVLGVEEPEGPCCQPCATANEYEVSSCCVLASGHAGPCRGY